MGGMSTIVDLGSEDEESHPPVASPSDIPVSVAMVYAAWGYAMLNGDPLLAEQLQTLLISAGADASAANGLDAAIATVGATQFPFERSPLDMAVAKLVASASVAQEFRLYSLHSVDIAGYLLNRGGRAEYIGSKRQHQVRHMRCTEILPPRSAASAGIALARGNPWDYFLQTDFSCSTQLRFSLGTACARYKPFDHPLLHTTQLTFFGEGATPAKVDRSVPIKLVPVTKGIYTMVCLHEADLLRLHAGLAEASWAHLSTTGYSMLARVPNPEVDESRQQARFNPRRPLRELTGLGDCHVVNLPRLLALELVWRHRWFAPARVEHWPALTQAAGERVAEELAEQEGWLMP